MLDWQDNVDGENGGGSVGHFSTIPRNDDNEMNNSSTNDGQFPIANFNLKQLNFQR